MYTKKNLHFLWKVYFIDWFSEERGKLWRNEVKKIIQGKSVSSEGTTKGMK